MRRSPKHIRNRRLALSAMIGLGVTAVLLIWLDLPATTDSSGLSGSMMEDSRLAPLIGWTNGSGSATLDDDIRLRWHAGPEVDGLIAVFASRDNRWNAGEDCLIGNVESAPLLAGDELRLDPRSSACIDAGPWNLFAVHQGEVVHTFDQPLHVANGSAGLERTSNTLEVGMGGMVEVELHVHRPGNAHGFDGVYQMPLDVWISNGKDVCVAEATPIDVQREPTRSGQSWKTSVHHSSVSLDAFRRVRNANPFTSEREVPSATDVSVRGNCSLEEGSYKVVVGPTERGWANEGTVYVHAPPVEISTNTLRVSIPAGEVGEAEFRLRNRSRNAITWNAEATTVGASKWLIAATGQQVGGGKRADGTVSFSARDLAPGQYASELRVMVDDFYGTEVRIPVELTVLTARSKTAGALDASSDPTNPAAIQLGNYPNPFSSSTTLRIELADGDDVRVHVYDMTGRELRTVHDGYLTMGVHEFRFEADDLPSGTYVYRVSTSRGQETGTMTLVR